MLLQFCQTRYNNLNINKINIIQNTLCLAGHLKIINILQKMTFEFYDLEHKK